MRYRRLGTSALVPSALGLGCMGMSDFYADRDPQEAVATIHRAIDRRVTFLDTADMYGVGRNEELVGQAIAGHRHQVLVATKFGNVRAPDGSYLRVDGSPDYVRQACEASLRRLRVEAIDLYYQHRVDPRVPIEETVGAMADLVRQGKVRYLGLSEAAPETIRRAHTVHPITALQTEYSLWTRDPEQNGVLATCRALGIGFVAYSPLGRGFLAGRITASGDLAPDDTRHGHPRFQGENLERNQALADRVRAFAREKGCTPAQLALAWLLRAEDVVPIPGTKRRTYLDENLGALEVEITDAEAARIADALPLGAASGERYPETAMRNIHL